MGVYKRGKAWWISYMYKGRQVRKSIGRNKRVAELALADITLKMERGEYLGIHEKQIWFKDFAERYLAYARANKAKTTADRDTFTIEVHLIPFFGD